MLGAMYQAGAPADRKQQAARKPRTASSKHERGTSEQINQQRLKGTLVRTAHP